MRLRVCLFLVLSASLARVAAAEPPEDTRFLGQLVGQWQMQGTVLGKPVRYRASGRWVLNGAWLELSMVDVARPAQYEAQLYLGYDGKAGDYIGHWLDRFGAAGSRVVATGERHERTLVLNFPYAEGAFRDTLTLAGNSASATLLIEAAKPGGGWSTFASYRMQRVAAGAHTRAAPQ
jgi:Protein of unknown function (DUF1579)